jgi:hypothetical protein
MASAIAFGLTGCAGDIDTTRCVPAGSTVIDGISEGLTVTGGGFLRNGWAVRSDDFRRIYFVGGEIDGPGIEGDGNVGLWAVNSLDEPALVFSINSTAREFSDWGDGGATDAQFSDDDDGAAEALACARA